MSSVAASMSEIEMRVRALETRVGRHDEDMGAVVDTTSKTFTVVSALARNAGLDVDELLAEEDDNIQA
ncbi:hypothetical protein [Actinomadura rudentiformis]|uniref:Uncharacterized protein n=1 Tax=Actinomadura rudentiformis TaxID=359158 RepID=A0A6H9YUT4_9ACTN|nr:hypothetical protein [Actinomadura rudentiformis]KAB2350819.1 hypothetical protein F8566_07560 [Actinomadura rudentiformis]